MPRSTSQRLQQLEAEIAARLRPVCAEFPDETFDAMVKGLAAITVKYERDLAQLFPTTAQTDELAEEMLRRSIGRREGESNKPQG